jgi:hypothetical protein
MSSFPPRDADDRTSMLAQLIPVRRSAHDVVTGSYAILALTSVAAPPIASDPNPAFAGTPKAPPSSNS